MNTLTEEQRRLAMDWVLADPIRYARHVLGHELWEKQAEILSAVAAAPQARVAVKACHSSSKTFSAAEAVLWWVTAYSDGIAVTTAPTWTQVERLLWGEIHKAILGAAGRLAYPPLNKTELRLGPQNYAIGLSTNEGVRFQGFHGRVLVVLDEAPGVLPEIYESIEGIRAGGDVRILALGNPVIASGPFFDAFTKNRHAWQTFTINAFDTPNLAGVTLGQLLAMSDEELDVSPCPYLVTRRWVREKHAEWGENHPLWQSRVLGDFPTQAEDALISLAWLEQGRRREPLKVADNQQYGAGIDVAGPGEDETVLVVRQGPNIIELRGWSNPDPRGDVVAALAPWRDKLEAVNVDSIGIGYNFGLHLRDQGLPVQMVNVGESPDDREKYANLKAELYWGLRLRCEAGDFSGLDDETAIGQLAGIRYKHNARGQVVIESKDDAKKRGVSSPDRAEAVMLAFASRRGKAGTLKVTGY